MPENHKLFVDQTPEAALEWAKNIGVSTMNVVKYNPRNFSNRKTGVTVDIFVKEI